MTKNSSSPPTGIPERIWNNALLQAKMSDKPFLVKRFDPTDNNQTYVFFGQKYLPLRLAVPMMMRLYEPMAMRKRNREKIDTTIRDHFEVTTIISEEHPASGFQWKATPKADSYYGLATYVKDRYDSGQFPNVLADFLAALRAK